MEAYVGVQGASFLQKKLAANAPMTHTITTDDGACDLLGFRLQEKAGPINSDCLYTVNGPSIDTVIVGKKFKERATWDGDTLVVTRVHEAGDFELVLTRRLDDGSDGTVELVLTSMHRDLLTGKETQATSWWAKTGPSPNAPVVVALAKPEISINASSSERSKDEVVSPAAKSLYVDDSAQPPDDVSSDGEDEDDPDAADEAIASPSKIIRKTSGKSGGSQVLASNAKSNTASFPRALSTTPRADMTGIWKRFDTVNYDNFVGAQGAGYVQRKLAASMALQHTIIMDPPIYSEFRLMVGIFALHSWLHALISRYRKRVDRWIRT